MTEARLSTISDPTLLTQQEREWAFLYDAEFHALCYIVGWILAEPGLCVPVATPTLAASLPNPENASPQ